MEIKRLLTNLCSPDLEKSKAFYTSLFQFTVDFDSDWFVHLISSGRELELGLIAENHPVVPTEIAGASRGMYLTFVVDDVDQAFEQAKANGYPILLPPEDTEYGQRRMLVQAPEGTVVDISSLMK